MKALESLEHAYKNHRDAEIKNIERLQTVKHQHTDAMCKAIQAIIEAFFDRKVYFVVEAEISCLQKVSRPEDFVAWVENQKC